MPHPLLVFSQLDYLIQVVDTKSHLMTNSADPDHLFSWNLFLAHQSQRLQVSLKDRQWSIVVCACVVYWCIQRFQTTSPLKSPVLLKLNYMRSLHGAGEQKFVHKIWITWQRCMIIFFENLLLKNRMADDLETWYAALMALSSLFKWWPWLCLTFLWQGQIWLHKLL